MACDEVRGECGHVRHGSFDGLSAATTMEHYSGGLREIPNREGAFHNPEMTMRFFLRGRTMRKLKKKQLGTRRC